MTVIEGTAHVFVGSTNGMLRAFTMDEADGSLTAAGVQNVGGLDFFTLGPDGTTLFVSQGNQVAAYSYDPDLDSFSFLHAGDTSGGGTHVTVDPSGQMVFLAHYGPGLLSFLSYDVESGFGEEQTSSPGQNAHQVRVRAVGDTVYVPCLGSDHVAQYSLDAGAGSLTPLASVAATGGPRHMDFHPSGDAAYVLTENSSEVIVYDVDAGTGTLTARPGARVFTTDGQIYAWSSDIKVTPSGSHLFIVNRDPTEIVAFEILADRTVARLASTALSSPVRSFAMDPKGKYLKVGGEDGVLQGFTVGPDGSLTEGASVDDLGNIRNAEIHYLD